MFVLVALAAALEQHTQVDLAHGAREAAAAGMKEAVQAETEDEFFTRLERVGAQSPTLASMRAKLAQLPHDAAVAQSPNLASMFGKVAQAGLPDGLEASLVETATEGQRTHVRDSAEYQDAQGACGPHTDRGCAMSAGHEVWPELMGTCDQDAVSACLNAASDELLAYYDTVANATEATADKICGLMHKQVACVPATCCRAECLACKRLPEDVREPDCSGVFSYKAAYYLMFQHAGWQFGEAQKACLPRSSCARQGVSTSEGALPLPMSQYTHKQITGITMAEEEQKQRDEARHTEQRRQREAIMADVDRQLGQLGRH